MFGISPLGWLHTLGSLPALPLALVMLYRHGRIDPRSALGKAYGGFMVLGAVTVYPIAVFVNVVVVLCAATSQGFRRRSPISSWCSR